MYGSLPFHINSSSNSKIFLMDIVKTISMQVSNEFIASNASNKSIKTPPAKHLVFRNFRFSVNHGKAVLFLKIFLHRQRKGDKYVSIHVSNWFWIILSKIFEKHGSGSEFSLIKLQLKIFLQNCETPSCFLENMNIDEWESKSFLSVWSINTFARDLFQCLVIIFICRTDVSKNCHSLLWKSS